MSTSSNINTLITQRDATERVEWLDYQIGYYIAKNKSGNEQNEDSLYLIGDEAGLIFGIADGAGGHPKGEVASAMVGQTISQLYPQLVDNTLGPLGLIEKINSNILDLKVGAKTTMAFALLLNDELRFFSVGDSEILFLNSLYNLIYSNIPQHQAGHIVEAGLIEQDESLQHPSRNEVSYLLGDKYFRMEVLSPLPFKRGQSVLIGSDGLFDNVSHEKIISLISGQNFENCFQDLKNCCSEREQWRKDDDISFIFLRKIRSKSSSTE